MDLVSIETPSENDLIEELIAGGNETNDKIMDIQCRNYKFFLSFRFYVKSTLENLEVLKMPFLPFLGL